MLKLKPSQLIDLLCAAYGIGEPVCVLSEPGVGKTAITEHVSNVLEATFIKSHPAMSDPTDGQGMPWITTVDGKPTAEFVPIGQMKKVLDSNGRVIWLIDDFLMAPDSVQKTFMQWLHGREAGGHVLPAGVLPIMCTNDRTMRAGATGMLEPIKSRVTFAHLVADMPEWATWLYAQDEIDGVPVSLDLRAETIAFLRFVPDLFLKFDPNTDLKNSPNPRTWAKSIKWLTRDLSDHVMAAAIAGVVGEDAANQRLAFRKMYRELPNVDAILTNPTTGNVPSQPSVLWATVGALTVRATDQNYGRIVQYAERIAGEAGRGDMASLLIRDITRRNPALVNTTPHQKLLMSELGALVTGELN